MVLLLFREAGWIWCGPHIKRQTFMQRSNHPRQQLNYKKLLVFGHFFLQIWQSHTVQPNRNITLFYQVHIASGGQKKNAGTVNYYLPSQKGTVGDQCDSEEPMSFPNTFSIVFRMKTPDWAPQPHFVDGNLKGPLKIN